MIVKLHQMLIAVRRKSLAMQSKYDVSKQILVSIKLLMSMLLKPSSCFLLTVGSVRCNRKCPEVTVVVNWYFINNTEFN